MLMYNRINFRDLHSNKPKNITHNEHEPTLAEKLQLERFWHYKSTKAKRFLRSFNDRYRQSASEHNDKYALGAATQMHHIFPKSSHLEISELLENLIALTPLQHFNEAHPQGNTQEINQDYQYALLLSKSWHIQHNLTQDIMPVMYDFECLKEVLAVGFGDWRVYEIDCMDFLAVACAIERHYGALE